MSEPVLAFGPFELLPQRRVLLRQGEPVPLGSRAIEILIALVSQPGKLFSKDELMVAAWPGINVEEVNLRVNIASLRKALSSDLQGNQFISTVPGLGYRFVADVESGERAWASTANSNTGKPASFNAQASFPKKLTRLVGRENAIKNMAHQLGAHRLVSITGPGGIGKTTVAVELGRTLGPSFEDGVTFVDLAPVGDHMLLPNVLAAALGIQHLSENPIDQLIARIDGRAILLILDSCEHLVEPVAILVQKILKETDKLRIVTTSREALRAEGEWVHSLPPLALPPVLPTLSADEAMQFSAVQLFVDRASETLGGYELSNTDAPIVAEICRRLDGLALAIELAASSLDAFGLRDLAKQLDDRFHILTRGRRTSLPRHQTLRATLDWSYELLSEVEREVLNRLSVFNGAFTLTACCEVAADDIIPAQRIPDAITALIAKSLLAADAADGSVRYRLLDSTQSYAREKLAARGRTETFSRRHALYYRDLFEKAEAEWDWKSSSDWFATYSRQIDNLRAALSWSFSQNGDASVGVSLILAAAPLWSQLSYVDECLDWVTRALDAPEVLLAQSDRRRMQLHATLGGLQTYMLNRLDQSTESWHSTLQMAEKIGDADYQLRALRALWADRINRGEFREAVVFARRFKDVAIAADVKEDVVVADRMMASPMHFMGEHERAQSLTDQMLARYSAPLKRSHVVRFQFDQRVAAKIIPPLIHLLIGKPDQAMEEIERTVQEALSLQHTFSLCNVLTQAACPIALLTGALTTAERYIGMLRNHTTMYSVDIWHTFCRYFEADLKVRHGHLAEGLSEMQNAIQELRRARFGHYLPFFLTTLSQTLARAGDLEQAEKSIEEALTICARTGERWTLAEIYRVRGELLRLRSDKPENVSKSFLQAIEVARTQKELFWELRAATSLARFYADEGRRDEAAAVLSPVCEKFSEGFKTEDVDAAFRMLAALKM